MFLSQVWNIRHTEGSGEWRRRETVSGGEDVVWSGGWGGRGHARGHMDRDSQGEADRGSETQGAEV